jgi:isopenicillin-N epimerase
VTALTGWALDPDIAFLNHGSYGASLLEVLAEQRRLQDRMEANPVQFLFLELPGLMASARMQSAEFIGANPDGYAFVTNATTGTNTLLRSVPLEAGDEILLTDHGYEACNLAAEHIAARRGASVVFARLPVPASDPAEIRTAILDAVTPRTRVAVIDHITSPTSLVLPVDEIVSDLAERGIGTIVDGAHAPGQVDLDVERIGALGYTANWHKWTCAPKGAGFLWAAEEWREDVRPLVISHGAGHRGEDGQRFRATFDWTGTADPTAYLAVPTAIDVLGGMLDGGWPAVRDHNRRIALQMRERLVEAFDLVAAGSPALTGSMASFVIPERWRPSGRPGEAAGSFIRRLNDEHGVVVGAAARRGTEEIYFRVSAHLHTPEDAVERLVTVLQNL